MPAEFTTRVYKYGAVPLGPFPEEGIEHLKSANKLWNSLVEIRNENQDRREKALRKKDKEYAKLKRKIENILLKIEDAKKHKNKARIKAATRSSDHPLIQESNEKLTDLYGQLSELNKSIISPRKRAAALIDQEALNTQLNAKINEAVRIGNSRVLRDTADQIKLDSRKSFSQVIKTPKAKMRFHRFDGTGYLHYRMRAGKRKPDGLPLESLFEQNKNNSKPFCLEPNGLKRGIPRFKLQCDVGANRKTPAIAVFDVVYHRPLPEKTVITSAKLMRNRVGDRFKFTVNFTVRVPEAEPVEHHNGAIGIDIGFRSLPDGTLRAATIYNSVHKNIEHVIIPNEFVKRMEHIQYLSSEMDQSATKLGQEIKPLLKKRKFIPEKHKKFKFLNRIAKSPAHITLSFEQAYKLGKWVHYESGLLPEKVEKKAKDWLKQNAKIYREMHHLRKKTLGWRKETYRIIAHDLVSHNLIIGREKMDLTKFAEVKDRDNELSDKARSQRFLVSPSEFIGAIENVAQREGIAVYKVPARNTSKKCSNCDRVHKELRAEVTWTCPGCGMEHDRDENAAKNIAFGAYQKWTSEIGKKASA
tara:strand:- start:1070 stop:2824 length:1755 start_codon:yes stop_codon:yes gene_type:complete